MNAKIPYVLFFMLLIFLYSYFSDLYDFLCKFNVYVIKGAIYASHSIFVMGKARKNEGKIGVFSLLICGIRPGFIWVDMAFR
jgi:hypothetical protein